MGWATGSEVMGALIASMEATGVDEPTKERVYNDMHDALSRMDWDTDHECLWTSLAYDRMMFKKGSDRYKEWYARQCTDRGRDDWYREVVAP